MTKTTIDLSNTNEAHPCPPEKPPSNLYSFLSNSFKLHSLPRRQVSAPQSVHSLKTIFEKKEQEKKDTMSYQSFLRATSNPVTAVPATYGPSPASSISRKPANSNSAASFRSVSPAATSQSHAYTPPPPSLQHSSNYTPSPSTPLSSFPPTTIATPTSTINTHNRNASEQPTTLSPSPIPPSNLPPLSQHHIDTALQTCLTLQNLAVAEHSKRPFAALLLAPDNTTILQTHFSISHFQHAESELARLAATQYSPDYLKRCTLVSTWEPCAMCSGTIYWAGIGRVLYAASEAKLKEVTGEGNGENLTMSLPCRTIFQAGQRSIEVVGPVSPWEAKVVVESEKWWKNHQAGTSDGASSSVRSVHGNGGGSVNGTTAGSVYDRRTSVSIYNPDESALGSIGEDGEYQADLKVDWMF